MGMRDLKIKVREEAKEMWMWNESVNKVSEEFLGDFGGIGVIFAIGIAVFFNDQVVKFGVELFPVVFADFAEFHKVQEDC